MSRFARLSTLLRSARNDLTAREPPDSAPEADALEKVARSLKQLDEQIQVYLLPSDPEGPSPDNDLHIAVLADVGDERLLDLNDAIADIVQDVNLDLDYNPFVVAHPTNRDRGMAQSARQNGTRL